MEPAEIAIVLARASELHGKISDAIARASILGQASAARQDSPFCHRSTKLPAEELAEETGLQSSPDPAQGDGAVAAEGGFPEVHSLTGIQDALEALEEQLETLQALQKQQKIERDLVLAELEENRKIFLGKLRAYHGTEWDVLQEAHAFAGEPVQRKDDLLLPPYSAPVQDSSTLPIHEQPTTLRRRSLSTQGNNGVQKTDFRNTLKGEGKSEQTQAGVNSSNNTEGGTHGLKRFSGFGSMLANFYKEVGQAVGFTTKTALVIASVVAILTFSQLEPRLRRRAAEKASKIRPKKPPPSISQNRTRTEEICPPGKVLLVQDGIAKCFVKERVEIPFTEVATNPDVFYGCG